MIMESSIAFVAVLVYAVGDDRRAIERHVVTATHPEIAYNKELAASRRER